MARTQFNTKHLERCYFCLNVWGECMCDFPKYDGSGDCQEPGFDFDESTWITAPNVSECGRFFVDPVECYGRWYVEWLERRVGLRK